MNIEQIKSQIKSNGINEFLASIKRNLAELEIDYDEFEGPVYSEDPELWMFGENCEEDSGIWSVMLHSNSRRFYITYKSNNVLSLQELPKL